MLIPHVKTLLTTVLLFPPGNEFLERYDDSREDSKREKLQHNIEKKLDLIKAGFPGCPMVRTPCQGTWVQSLVGETELPQAMLRGAAKK